VAPGSFSARVNVDENNKETAPLSWLPLSRGLEPYLGAYSPEALVLWLAMTLRAEWREGQAFGTVEISIGRNPALEEREASDSIGVFPDIAARTGLGRRTVRTRLLELSKGHPIGILTPNKETAPPFIRIVKSSGRTRGKTITVQILKAKLTAKQFKARPRPPAHARQKSGQDSGPGPMSPIVDSYSDPETEGEAILATLTDKVLGARKREAPFGPGRLK